MKPPPFCLTVMPLSHKNLFLLELHTMCHKMTTPLPALGQKQQFKRLVCKKLKGLLFGKLDQFCKIPFSAILDKATSFFLNLGKM